jgi:hypothetical protein
MSIRLYGSLLLSPSVCFYVYPLTDGIDSGHCRYEESPSRSDLNDYDQ